jgi:altronate hydrolase
MKTPALVHIHPRDNVAVALKALLPGAVIGENPKLCRDRIPAGHKVSLVVIPKGQPVYKYGQIIGFAAADIQPGEHVHTHNMGMGDFNRDYAIGQNARPVPLVPEDERPVFEGIRRDNGKVATRNYVGVLSTVNCSAGVSRFIADALKDDIQQHYPNVDGIVALGHGGGCCHTPGSEGFDYLQRTMAGYARNPNFGGILLVGLGCEGNQVACLMENMRLCSGPLLQAINIQTVGGTRAAVERGAAALRAMLPQVNAARRQKVPVTHITLGLECGGSDAYSGISANPALGAAVDLLVQNGATAILSETPEIYGAEHLLTRRAANRSVADQLIRRIGWWKDYTRRHGGELNNNPSPGNKAGGLTTILEKSLGAASKGGSTPLNAVYEYARPVDRSGLVFMDTPGYDVVSITGMIAGGANLICFTTGRGTVCGFKPVPTIKLASNTRMFEHMADDMDINCGTIVDGDATVKEKAKEIFNVILAVASGKKVKSELHGFGDAEFVPWHIGAVV